jgi:tektin-3
VDQIHLWKTELYREIGDMDKEIKDLVEHKRVLEKAYADTQGPLQIAEECLLQREKRVGIDQVHDDVEKQLTREVSLIKNVQDKMRKLIEKTDIQLKLNRAAQHDCERDSKDKHHAQGIDDRMTMLRNTSAGISYHPGIESVDNTLTIPYSWMKFTQENITRSQREREMSEKLRGEIDSSLRAWANLMWSQFNCVNNSFNSRINELNDAKNKLQAHLHKTINEIRDMERSLALLRQSIDDKEGPLKVAQTRLQERTNRINVELCKDPSMLGLQAEVYELKETIRVLKERLRQAENSLVRLCKTKSTLEYDISVKENSLLIDNNYCMGMRKNMPLDPKVGPINHIPTMGF